MLSKEQCLGAALGSENNVYQQFKSAVQQVMKPKQGMLSCGSQQC